MGVYKKKSNVLIIPNYIVPHLGGVETHVDEFSKYLVRDESKDFRVTIFAPNIPNDLEIEKKHDNKVTIVRYPAVEIISNYPIPKFWSPKLYSLVFKLYKQDFDIVMTRTRFFLSSFLGVLFAKVRIKPIKHVHVEHGSEFVEVESKLVSKVSYFYDMTIGKFVFLCADEIVAISQVSYDFVKEYFAPKRKVHLFRRGVDFEEYENDDIHPIKEKYEGKIIIGWVGRMYKWKGVKNAINAYKSLPEDLREKSVFLIVGYGEDEDDLKKLARNEKNIVFLGKKPFDESIQLFKIFDIFVHCANPGGALSNSLLQAMYCKCAIVASPHEGAKDVINSKTGILLEDNSPKFIKSGFMKLLEDKNLGKDKSLIKQYSKEAHDYIFKNFAWEGVVKKYLKVLK